MARNRSRYARLPASVTSGAASRAPRVRASSPAASSPFHIASRAGISPARNRSADRRSSPPPGLPGAGSATPAKRPAGALGTVSANSAWRS